MLKQAVTDIRSPSTSGLRGFSTAQSVEVLYSPDLNSHGKCPVTLKTTK